MDLIEETLLNSDGTLVKDTTNIMLRPCFRCFVVKRLMSSCASFYLHCGSDYCTVREGSLRTDRVLVTVTFSSVCTFHQYVNERVREREREREREIERERCIYSIDQFFSLIHFSDTRFDEDSRRVWGVWWISNHVRSLRRFLWRQTICFRSASGNLVLICL